MNAVFKPMLSPNGQVQYNGSAYELVSTGTTLDDLDAQPGGGDGGAEPGKAATAKKPWWRKVFSRKTFIIAATLLVLTGVFIGLVFGGIALRDNRVRIVRAINRSFDADIVGSGNASQALLVVEQHYQTLDATKLYFELGSGFNFLVYLYLVPDPSNLDDRSLVMKFTEPSSLHGSMQDGQVYYVSRLHRVTCKYNTVPSILFLPTTPDDIDVTRSWRSVITTTSLSSTVLATIFPNRKNYAYGLIHRHSLVPSPSTRVAAAMVTMIAAEEVDSTGAPIPHKPRYYYPAMTFFNMYTGVLEGAVPIPTTSRMSDMHLVSNVPNRTQPEYLIWSTDGTGVYALNNQEAFFILSESPYTVTAVTMVPETANPTHGGPVSDLGWVADIKMRGNAGVLSTQLLPSWVAFRNSRLIPFGTQNYTTSDAFDWSS